MRPGNKLRAFYGLGLCLLFFFTGACTRTANSEAHRLVEEYAKVVSEAYRKGDVKLIDPVVGPNEGRKLTGLIGVRLDGKLVLDAQMLSLEVKEVAMTNNEMHVRTSEKWHYCDRNIDTGKQVGEASDDSYEMLYIFKKIDGKWLVDETRFIQPPQVSRKTLTWGPKTNSIPTR